jgi:DNA-binding CsgD family transcriptional regulator
MTDIKEIIRQDRIVEMLAQCRTLTEMAEELKINEKTVRRDIKSFHKRIPRKKDHAFVQLIATREYLLRQSVDVYDSCESDKARINALMLRLKILDSLEKVYDRFGLMPNLNEIDEIHGLKKKDEFGIWEDI